MKLVTDERGVVWTVSARDPAKQYVNNLHGMGFTYIVLPRYTLMTGTIPETQTTCDDFLRNVRLQDCVLVTQGKHTEVSDLVV